MAEFLLEDVNQEIFESLWKDLEKKDIFGFKLLKTIHNIKKEEQKQLIFTKKFQTEFEALQNEPIFIFIVKELIKHPSFVEKYISKLPWKKLTNQKHTLHLLQFFISNFRFEELNLSEELLVLVIDDLIKTKEELNKLEIESKKCQNHTHDWVDQNGPCKDPKGFKIDEMVYKEEEIKFPRIKKFKKKEITITKLLEQIDIQLYEIEKNLTKVPQHNHKIKNTKQDNLQEFTISIGESIQIPFQSEYEPCAIDELSQRVEKLRMKILNKKIPLHIHKLLINDTYETHFKEFSDGIKYGVGELKNEKTEIIVDIPGKNFQKFTKIYRPSTIEEAISCMKFCFENKYEISVGGMMSTYIKDRFIKNSVFIDTTKLNEIIEIDNEFIIVQTGVNKNDLLSKLQSKGLSLVSIDPFFNRSIGGLIASNYRGFDKHSIIDTIISMKIISKEGKLQELKEDFDKIDGLIVEAKLKIQQNEMLQKHLKIYKKHEIKNLLIDSLHFCRITKDENIQIATFDSAENGNVMSKI
eukprot:gene12865-7288_t